jgi:hypothetical protein
MTEPLVWCVRHVEQRVPRQPAIVELHAGHLREQHQLHPRRGELQRRSFDEQRRHVFVREQQCSTSPEWVDVGASSAGTETTQPVGANFALSAGSPAIGYGKTQGYLPAQSVDVGACSHALATCP